MKPKTSKFITYILMLCGFVFLFAFVSNKVEAANATTDLYYPDTTLAKGYNADGTVNIGVLDVYAHNNGAGYQINQTKNIRISKLQVL